MRWVLALAGLLIAGSGTGNAPLRTAPLGAQSVLLRIRPPIGDTLRMRMEQHFEMRADGGGVMAGSIAVWTRAVPLRRVGNATELVSVTDSVVVMPPTAAALAPLRAVKRALEGRVVRARMAADGELTLLDKSVRGAPGPVLADMASVLPTMPVSVGQTWARAVSIPVSASGQSMAVVHTAFRLDSLAPDGTVAYLSLRGSFAHDHGHDRAGESGQATGTVSGTMQIDRRLGWITDSRTTITIQSVSQHAGAMPTRVHMTVTQWLRALPAD